MSYHDLPQILCLTEHNLNHMELHLIHIENYLVGSYYCRKHTGRWYLHFHL
jgi:hypothetical protein